MPDRSIAAVVPSVLVAALPSSADPAAPVLARAEREALIGSLEKACTQQSWIGIHAAEALISCGRTAPAVAAFSPQAESVEPRYRVGVWRVLARSHPDGPARDAYVARIRATLVDERAPDRLHALEALAKLGAPITTDDERRAVATMALDPAAAPFALWRLAQARAAGAVDRLIAVLKNPDAVARARAAYVLARLPDAGPAAHPALEAALAKEEPGTVAHAPLTAAVGGDALRKLASSATPADRYTAAMAFADHGTPADRHVLDPLMTDADDDVRVAAAFALLAIDSRHTHPATRPRP